MATEAGAFFVLWLRKPSQIAAVNPSSQRLADAVAAQVDFTRPGPVLELGAGTGALTSCLIRAGCPPERIIAIEGEPGLARILRRKFPSISVVETDARRLGEHPAIYGQALGAVVSSLPIKWFSPGDQLRVMRPCLDRLGPDGRFIQLTNTFRSPVAIELLGLSGCEVARVWRNLLPAQIWISSDPQQLGSLKRTA
jgi:phosphatidylethanolamine/phosphatidyl-N-methylethanolamine N-methyltransferase